MYIGMQANSQQLRYIFYSILSIVTVCIIYVGSRNKMSALPDKEIHSGMISQSLFYEGGSQEVVNASVDETETPELKFGYVLATHFVDQITGSRINLLSLQCYASTLSPQVRVVEPFIHHTALGVNLYPNEKYKTTLNEAKFSDAYDMKEWKNLTLSRGFAPLVSWDHFLKHAPRKLVVVKNVHESELSYIDSAETFNFFEYVPRFARKHGFEIVRNVTIPKKIFREKVYKTLLYGHLYNPSEVVVLYRLWGGIEGISSKVRLAIRGKSGSKVNYECKRSIFPTSFSSKIIQDGKRYVSKYLRNGANGHYISLMLRMEIFVKLHDYFKGKTEKEILSVTNNCFDAILRRVDAFKGSGPVFMTMDHRKQGSDWFLKPTMPLRTVANAANNFFYRVYKNLTLEQWDESFESIASFPNTAAYIALLQKHLAASGDCLLTAGGGSFQRTALQLYKHYHSNGMQCFGPVTECFPPGYVYVIDLHLN